MPDYGTNDQSKFFYGRNGTILRSLGDLKSALDAYARGEGAEEFGFHSRNNNNDYANWLEGVFGLHELASELRQQAKPGPMAELVSRKIMQKPLEQPAAPQEATPKMHQAKEERRGAAAPSQTSAPDQEYSYVPEPDETRMREMTPDERRQMDEAKGFISNLGQESDNMFDSVKRMRQKSHEYRNMQDEKLNELKEEYDALYASIVAARKAGKDMFIPELKIRLIKPKISYYEMSQNQDDYDKITAMIDDVKAEVKEAREREEPDLEKEVLKGAGLYKERIED